MKKLTESLAMKITAIILSFIAFAAVFMSVVAVIFLLDWDGYTKTRDEIRTDIMENRIGNGHIYNILEVYENGESVENYCDEQRIYYTIEDYRDGGVLEGNYTGQSFLVQKRQLNLTTYEERAYEDENGDMHWTSIERSPISITVYIPREALSGNGQLLVNVVDTAFTLRYAVLVLLGVSVVMLIILLCYLYAAQSHRKGGVVALNHLDRIPFDLLTAAVAVIALFSAELIIAAGFSGDLDFIVALAAILSADYFVALGYTLSFAARLKTHSLLKNNILYKLGFIAAKGIKKVLAWFKYLFKNIPTVAKTAIITSAVGLFQFIIIAILPYYYSGERTVLLLLFTVVDVAVIISLAVILQKIKQGGEKIAAGDLEYKIDTKFMYGDFKDFANSLNNINEGLSVAINEKMKSERFKTELITNVSHDIKTPLTSIINYVDLIKREEPENENIKEYIDVLDRQSSRLKKLIEDLMEASKASTGNLAVNLTVCEAGVLLSQTVGEFDERLKAAGLTPVVNIPETPVKIMADGRHLWRVFDNLMNNICKYSQVGTRVYLDVSEREGKAQITFRNISKYELNITGEELTERFVRGDKSRNTEGSGLGLSISKSLTELQNGSLKIDIDGDLFKVTLTFDTL
ncbi:MAG: histidine kinase dimerization/phospho-acceptor domain-containing protein [Acutalibacteraceae bacterium]